MIRKCLPIVKRILFWVTIVCGAIVTYSQEKAIKYAEATDDISGFFDMYFSDANGVLLRVASIAGGLYILFLLPPILRQFKSFLGMDQNE